MMARRRESRAEAGPRRRGPLGRAALSPLSAPFPGAGHLIASLALVLALCGGFAPGFARADDLNNAKLALADPEKPAPSLPPATADAVSLDDAAAHAKLSFDFSHPIDGTAFVLANPNRVVIDLPEVDFQIDPQTGTANREPHRKSGHQKQASGTGLIASYRFGLFAPGKSRIVIDLTEPARIVRAAAEPTQDGGPTRFVIELARTDRAAFQAAARKAMMAAADAEPKTAEQATDTSGDNRPVVVVDPGHGGLDSGAMIDGLVEKDIVFAFAKEVADKLRATGRYKVVMTRDSDIFIPLGGRVQIARDAHAALFVSIHADTLAAEATVNGATVYTMADKASDADAARTAEQENQSDATAGIEGQEETSGVNDILFDLTRQETRAFSHVFARTLVNYWRVASRLNKNPERAAGFRVLTAPDVPSVLLELGYLSNVTDGKSLVSSDWRDATTSKVVASINAFFDARGQNATANDPAAGKNAAAALDTTPTGAAK
jgi:N-acetylmuramoyl-L-alanine amidase